jgi:hypothetical protein
MKGVPDLVLVVAAVLGLAWVLVPRLMFALGLVRVRTTIDARPALAEPDASDPDYAGRYQQFVALGFRPAGAAIQRCWFITPSIWYRCFDDIRLMVAPDGAVAGLYRMIRWERIRLSVRTTLSHEGLVVTESPGSVARYQEGRFLREMLPPMGPEEFLRRHRDNVSELCRDQGLVITPAPLEQVGAIEDFHGARFLVGQTGFNAELVFLAGPALWTTLELSGGTIPHDWRAVAWGACAGVLAWVIWLGIRQVLLYRSILASHDPAK